MSATLSTVASRLVDVERRGRDVSVVDVTHDSSQVRAGWLFCAVRGERRDGHDHVDEALSRGAAGLVVERWVHRSHPQLRVASVREVLGEVSAAVHGDPSGDLVVVGVTGTNGKTTVTHLLEGAFAASGMGTGIIGTVGTRVLGESVPGVRTTPEGTDLQRLLARMCSRGVDAVSMEVSSHGLDLRRVDGTRFDVAVFTNLSRDHLDWHGSMESYFAAKARLFTPELARAGVVVVEDDWGRRLAQQSRIPVTTVGRDPGCDVRLSREEVSVEGGRVVVEHRGDRFTVTTGIPGRFNLLNAVVAVIAADVAGADREQAVLGVAAAPGIPGRLERVLPGSPPEVLVDYAHTPAALEAVLTAVRETLPAGGRLVLVVGAGGDRDREKRAPMGAAAAAADVVVLTTDNPRSEDPDAIIAELRRGVDQARAGGSHARLEIVADRREAISAAIGLADPGDVVVVAGKGHEATQELADRVVAFDDRAVARDVLASSAAGGRTR